MDFKDVLIKHGFDLGTVMLMRHRPKEPELRKVLPWLATGQPVVFNAYQQSQHPNAETALMKADVVASFIAQESDQAVFVGLYRQRGWRSVTAKQFWANRAVKELRKFGMTGLQGRKTCLWFNLKPENFCPEWKGRMVVTWPPGRLWWRWAKTNDFPIYAIHEESVFETQIPPWDHLSLTWKDLSVMPPSLKAALRQWRGIYYIFDTKIGQGYVGSACGNENILGRWLNYRASGHGGNKKLKERNPDDFLFTILQRTSPDMEREQICQLEESWKDRLHTLEYGLNDN